MPPQIRLSTCQRWPYTDRVVSRFEAQPLNRKPLPPPERHVRKLCGLYWPDLSESVSLVREQPPPIATFGAQRRSTRVAHSVPVVIRWADRRTCRTVVESTATVSVNCHGFQYFSKQRPPKNAVATFQITVSTEQEEHSACNPEYPGRVAWVRKSRRLDGLCLVGIELDMPSNIWDVDEVPEDWALFSPPAAEDPATFLAEIDQILDSARAATYYQVLGVQPNATRSEVQRHYYKLAHRFHPDHHMDRPDLTARLVTLMEGLTAAYKTLSDEHTKKEYDSLLARGVYEEPSAAKRMAQTYLDRAQECISEKNFAGGILWLHRAIESEPNCSTHRAMLGRCLSAIPEYRREAVEQFEMAIDLDPRNLTAHLQYGELLEHLNLPGRARSHYLRVLALDANHREARQRLNGMGPGAARVASGPSLLSRLTGRRAR
jgi:DnaJ-like protein